MRLALLAKRHSIHSVRWANALAGRGHEVHLISAERHGEPLDPAVNVHFLPLPPPLGFYLDTPALRRLLKSLRPDLLNAHYASGYGTLARLAGFHPTVLSVWGSDVFDFPRKSKWHAGLIAANLRFADAVTSTSEVMARQTHKLAPVESLSVVPFGVDLERFRPQPKSRAGASLTIGTVKTMAHKYGIDTLLEAFKELRGRLEAARADSSDALRLHLVGGGPQLEELRSTSASLGLSEAVDFVGQVGHEEVPGQLAQLDVYVALSRLDSESFGVAVLEASAMGLPVVVSDAGGLPEVVVDGVTGIVVPREDPAAAATALERLANDPAMRAAMGEAGRRHVVEHYSWDACVQRMEEVYETVLAGRRTPEARGAST